VKRSAGDTAKPRDDIASTGEPGVSWAALIAFAASTRSELEIARTRPRWNQPVTLPSHLPARVALWVLDDRKQAIGFVATSASYASIVTVEDLRFACEWAGSDATVAQAATYALVELSCDADIPTATQAYCEALQQWVSLHRDDHETS